MKIEMLDIPEWGGSVCLRPMSIDARIRLDTLRCDPTIFIVVHCLCDERGELLFTEDDIVALSEKSASAIARIRDHAANLSGITKSSLLARTQEMHRSGTLRYVHELAERLGMTTDELKQRIDSAELLDWIAFDSVNLDPSWLQTAQICFYLCHVNGKPKRKVKVSDFLPPRALKLATDDEINASMRLIADSMAGSHG